jgi:NADH-quinone oxidoreductase subunit M
MWAAFAASGVVLGAAYMLYLYQRTMFGTVTNPKNERLLDLNQREFATFAPLLILAVWIGLYPAPFLRRLERSVEHIVSRVNTQYAQAYARAADCGGGAVPAANAASRPPEPGATARVTTGTAAPAAASSTSPTGAFLVATPCDANPPSPAATAGQVARPDQVGAPR